MNIIQMQGPVLCRPTNNVLTSFIRSNIVLGPAQDRPLQMGEKHLVG